MNKVSIARVILSSAAVCIFAPHSAADPPDILRNYRFIPSHTTVHVSGGIAGYNLDLEIAGQLGLVTGYDYSVDPTAHVPTLVPHAEFVNVNGYLFNPLSLAPLPVPGWDLDKTFNLSGLDGSFRAGDPNHLLFKGNDGQDQPIKLSATIYNRLLHIVGENTPGCCDFYHYEVDAFAHLVPYPDFNLDGSVNAADYVGLRKSGGSQDDYSDWVSEFGSDLEAEISAAMLAERESLLSEGSVPEPATLTLVGGCVIAISCYRRRRDG
jgi:hypothetical protein